MKIKKVLLLVPRYAKSRYRSNLGAGIGYIAEALYENGIEYRYLDMAFADSAKTLSGTLKEFRPDLIGISMLTFRYKDHYRLARYIKDTLSRALVGVGGAHACLCAGKILEDCPSVDIVFRGEGERALIDLCNGKDCSEIRGLIYSDNGKIKDTGKTDFIYDLDSLSFPRYRGFALERYIDRRFNVMPVISSRGCPYQCSYCPVEQSMGCDFRMRSATGIIDEIEYWFTRGYYRFSISDDNFTLDRARVVKICAELKKRNLKGLKLSCDNGIRADRVDRALLGMMKEAGFWRIAYGVEAGNDKILCALGKGLDLATTEKAIKDACDLGYTVRLFFLIGSPKETWSDFEDSLRLAKKYPVFEVSFYHIIPYPGTSLFSWIQDNGCFLDRPENYLHYAAGKMNIPVFYTREFSLKERESAFIYARKVSSKIVKAALKEKLKSFGLLGSLVSELYGINLFNRLLEWPLSRKLILRFLKHFIDKVLAS
ncbi:MAG: radical SAM protein [Candidatus Omnitrophota bacterium]